MDWAIPEPERQKYTSVFLQLSENDQSAKLSGALVRPILMKSNLDITKLGKIWTLSDIDKDGNLDKDEFIVAMYLVYKSLTEGCDPPESLPQNIVPPSKRPKSVPPSRPPPPAGANYGALSGLTLDNPAGFSAFDSAPKALGAPPAASLPTETLITPPTPAFSADFGSFEASQPSTNLLTGSQRPSVPAAELPYLVPKDKHASYAKIYDASHDSSTGTISAMAAKDVFIQSGLPNSTLAQVWNLSDTNQSGSLSRDQFVLAMHLLAAALQGHPLPSKTSEAMIRASQGDFSDLDQMPGTSTLPITRTIPQVAPELQGLQNEMSQLQAELDLLERQVEGLKAQKESQSSTMGSLQVEIDQFTTELTQAETSLAVAKNEHSSVEAQRVKLVQEGNELNSKLATERGSLAELEAQLRDLSSGPNPAVMERQRLEGIQIQQTQAALDRDNQFKLLTEVKAERLRMDKILSDLESEKAKRDRPKEKSPSFSPSPTNHVPASMSATTLSGMSELRHDILDDQTLGSISPNTTPALTPVSAALDNLTLSGGSTSKSPTPESSATPDHLSALESIKALNTGGSIQSSQISANSSVNQAPLELAATPEASQTNSADPFGASNSGADPFAAAPMADDPFASSNQNGGAFGNDPFASGNDPFGSGEDPFATPPVDPFNGTADPFATNSDPFGTSDDVPDPFGDDPFASAPMPSSANNGTSQNTREREETPETDPWGSAFGDSDGTFVNSSSTATFGFDSTPAQPEKKNQKSKSVSSTMRVRVIPSPDAEVEKPPAKPKRVAPARPPPARPAPSRPPPPGGL